MCNKAWIVRLWYILSVYSIQDMSCLDPQILTELEHSGMGRNKEQAAKMLGHLVSRAPRLIRPYMEPILKVGNADTEATQWSLS